MNLLSFQLAYTVTFLPALALPGSVNVLFCCITILLVKNAGNVTLACTKPVMLKANKISLYLFISTLSFNRLLKSR